MLHKLAAAATWLDAHDLFAESNLVTGVFLRVATDLVSDDDESENETSPEESWRAPTYHNSPKIQSASPAFLDMMKSENPEGHEWWTHLLKAKHPGFDPGKGISPEEHSHSLWLGGREIQVPRGYSGMSSDDASNFFFSKAQQDKNGEEFERRLDKVTRGKTRRSTLDVDYLSSSKPKSEESEELKNIWKPRPYSFDPHALAYLGEHWEQQKAAAEAAGKTYNTPDPRTSRVPLFDSKVKRQIFDPSDASGEAIRAKLEGKPLGTQLGNAFRGNMSPSKVFGLHPHPQEKDDLTGLPRKNFYIPKKSLK